MRPFSPSWVYNLSREQLDQLAGQEAATKRKRRQLQKQAKELKTGRKIYSSFLRMKFHLLFAQDNFQNRLCTEPVNFRWRILRPSAYFRVNSQGDKASSPVSIIDNDPTIDRHFPPVFTYVWVGEITNYRYARGVYLGTQ
ncbi:hypothetical protein N7540_010954 [Penicillium herquei]|nr:hypothetical protein N7540_010954 [Penicillium herquei]